MQQAVGGKCGIVIMMIVPVGEGIYMRQEQFRRVGIHCEVQFITWPPPTAGFGPPGRGHVPDLLLRQSPQQ